VKIRPDLVGERLDRAIAETLRAEHPQVSVREVRIGLRDKRIRLSPGRKPGDRAQADEPFDASDFVTRAEATIAPEALRISILAQTSTLLVLDKPSGMPCAPLRPGEPGTLLAQAVAVAPQIATAGPPLEGGLVHRLDTATSGIVVFAKDLATRERLRDAFGAHQVLKTYLAGCSAPRWRVRTLEAAIGPSGDRVRLWPLGDRRGQDAITEARVLKTWGPWVRIEARTRYGRRHQVRVQLSDAGAPIVGDAQYGGVSAPRLLLHAHRLTLPDGTEFVADPPPDFEETWAALETP